MPTLFHSLRLEKPLTCATNPHPPDRGQSDCLLSCRHNSAHPIFAEKVVSVKISTGIYIQVTHRPIGVVIETVEIPNRPQRIHNHLPSKTAHSIAKAGASLYGIAKVACFIDSVEMDVEPPIFGTPVAQRLRQLDIILGIARDESVHIPVQFLQQYLPGTDNSLRQVLTAYGNKRVIGLITTGRKQAEHCHNGKQS